LLKVFDLFAPLVLMTPYPVPEEVAVTLSAGELVDLPEPPTNVIFKDGPCDWGACLSC
jgi:hypothetical protein